MNELSDMTPEELEQILGSDYETLIADALRNKGEAQSRDTGIGRQIGQVGNGHVFFDPGAAVEKYANRYRADKDKQAAQGDLDTALGAQKQSRRTYADVITRGPPAPQAPADPRTADSTIPTAEPAPSPPPMAAGAPPALAQASTMTPEGLNKAGVPLDVQELLRKLRGG